MNVSPYLHFVPEIEKEIVDKKLDSLICGLGPTAWLLRYVNRRVLHGLRLWGCHDGCRMMPMHDIVVMDPPQNALNPDTTRFKHIIDCRPERLWFYYKAFPLWKPHIAESMHAVSKSVEWAAWTPQQTKVSDRFQLVAGNPHTLAVSPTGMTTLAWREGCRRIGVIGADMMQGHHTSHSWHRIVDAFFTRCAEQAAELGGLICNLSPISSLTEFRQWQPNPQPASSSAPIPSSTKPEPKQPSSTASASMPLSSHGLASCELVKIPS